MRRRAASTRWLLAGFLVLGLGSAAPPPADAEPAGRIIDLTHAFDAQTVYWPTEAEGFVLERGAAGTTEQGFHYEAHRFRSAEHGGTHIDAPIHFFAGRWTVEQIPIERLVGRAIAVDVSDRCSRDADYRVSVADFERWEATHDRIPQGAIVLIHTGYSRRWPDLGAYLGTEKRGAQAVAELHFPGLHPDAAKWLVEERGIHAVGLDTASIDYGQSEQFRSHRILFEANVPALENLTQLHALPPKGFEVYALPMKIRGGSGAPLRAIAVLPAD